MEIPSVGSSNTEVDYLGNQIEELRQVCKTLQTSPVLRLSQNLDFIKESIRQMLTNQGKFTGQQKDINFWLDKHNKKIDQLVERLDKIEKQLQDLETLIKS